jgi:hypothetical protein
MGFIEDTLAAPRPDALAASDLRSGSTITPRLIPGKTRLPTSCSSTGSATVREHPATPRPIQANRSAPGPDAWRSLALG